MGGAAVDVCSIGGNGLMRTKLPTDSGFMRPARPWRFATGAPALATILCLLPGPSVRAASASHSGPATAGAADSLRFAAGDTIEIVARRFRPLSPTWSLPLPGYLTTPRPAPDYRRHTLAFTALTRPRIYERPRAIRALYGADQVAGTAAALGGLGMVGGLWGEKTAAYMMGAGAILGALWGGTIGADDPRLRFGLDARAYGPGSERRSERIQVKKE
jgi:hypothetical protein